MERGARRDADADADARRAARHVNGGARQKGSEGKIKAFSRSEAIRDEGWYENRVRSRKGGEDVQAY
jgi:hypothetical protein